MTCKDKVDALGDRIAHAAAALDRGEHKLLTAVREFDQVDGWHRQGALSFPAWLSWRIGMTKGAAREKVRVAKALGGLSKLDAALAAGDISYSKVRAMTRVATPKTEETLLEIAQNSTAAQLEKVCRLYRGVQTQGQARAAEDRRYVSSRSTNDGMVVITARLHPDEAARVMEAARVSAETANAADGLVTMAEATLRGDKPERNPTEVMVRVDASTLEGELEDGTGVSAEVAQRLLCDAGIVPVLQDEKGRTLDVGRKTRTIPPAMRRALALREATCQFPGCENRRFLDAHHIEHWATGGETKLKNLMRVCRRHHRHLHEFGFEVERIADGELQFRNADGDVIPEVTNHCAAQPPPEPSYVSWPAWDGRAPDYPFLVSSLVYASQ